MKPKIHQSFPLMVTGDNALTARSVAEQVGIPAAICSAEELKGDLRAETLRDSVFAGVFPEDKYKLVRAFQRRGEIVAMSGDGVNDAPALRQAEAGVALANATDVAKAAAALVLTHPGPGDVTSAIQISRYESGANVVLPRARYAGFADRMNPVQGLQSGQDLLDQAAMGLDIASGLGEHITLVGLSGSAVAAAWMAQHRDGIQSVVLVSPFFGVHGLPVTLVDIISSVLARVPNFYEFPKALGIQHDMIDPNQPDAKTQIAYPKSLNICAARLELEETGVTVPGFACSLRLLGNRAWLGRAPHALPNLRWASAALSPSGPLFRLRNDCSIGRR